MRRRMSRLAISILGASTTWDRKFEDVVKSVEQATVLVLVY